MQRLVSTLKNYDFKLEDKERSGAHKKFEDKELEEILDEDRCKTLAELGKYYKLMGLLFQNV